jgi:serine/threonine-protein kinase
VWPHAYAETVETAEEAKEALAAVPGDAPIPPFSPLTFLVGDIGRTMFLGGRNEEAVRWLRNAAESCYGLEFPIEHTRASYWYGQALERAGDRDGACKAYRRVLDRWGAAKPRSITAAGAAVRARAMGCP